MVILVTSCAAAPKVKNVTVVNKKGAESAGLREIKNRDTGLRLPDYEKLFFDVKWLGLRVATLTSSITGIINFNGRDVYVIEAEVKTNNLFPKKYKMESKFISYMDVERSYTLRQEVCRKEGKKIRNAVIDFDQIKHKAHFKNLINKKEKDFDIPEGVQDALSACYYFRLIPLNPGEGIEYSLCHNEQNLRFFGFAQSKALIKTPATGKKAKETFLIRPYAKFKSGKLDEGNVIAYYSSEKKRIPLLAKINLPLFPGVTIILAKIEEKQTNN